MGLSALAITGIASLVVGVAGTAHQVDRSQAAGREQKRASRKAERAGEISTASKERERQLSVRQQARQERIRRAQVLSAAEASGVTGSSVETSTIGSGQTIGATGTAFATGSTIANAQISSLNQQAQDFRDSAAFKIGQGQLGGAVAGLAQTGLQAASAFDIGGGVDIGATQVGPNKFRVD